MSNYDGERTHSSHRLLLLELRRGRSWADQAPGARIQQRRRRQQKQRPSGLSLSFSLVHGRWNDEYFSALTPPVGDLYARICALKRAPTQIETHAPCMICWGLFCARRKTLISRLMANVYHPIFASWSYQVRGTLYTSWHIKLIRTGLILLNLTPV